LLACGIVWNRDFLVMAACCLLLCSVGVGGGIRLKQRESSMGDEEKGARM